MKVPIQTPEVAIRGAIEHLKAARDLLAVAHAPKAVAKVRLALKSAEGAERHAQCVASRARSSLSMTTHRQIYVRYFDLCRSLGVDPVPDITLDACLFAADVHFQQEDGKPFDSLRLLNSNDDHFLHDVGQLLKELRPNGTYPKWFYPKCMRGAQP